MKILHITTHLGGGAGKAISGIVCSNMMQEEGVQHRILLLQIPEKMNYVDVCKDNGVEVIVFKNNMQIVHYVNESDIIIIDWWNHPAMAKFLAEFPLVPVKIILWSHVNGCFYPYIPYEFIDICAYCFFTSEFSYENSFWTVKNRENILRKSKVVYGIGDGFKQLKTDYKTDYKIYDTVKIGYIGTLNYGKLNSQFIKSCEQIIKNIPNVTFVLYGDISDDLKKDILSSHFHSYFKIMGYATNTAEILKTFDIFGYPLAYENYATTENSLLEAMIVGLPIVAINQNTEKYIIKDCKTGLLADDMEDYVYKISALSADKNLREYLGKNARENVKSDYDVDKNIRNYYNGCKKVSDREKQIINFKNIIGREPYDWFLTFTGKYRSVFEECIIRENSNFECTLPDIFRAKKKSSIIHFADFYEEDYKLNKIKACLKNIKKSDF